MTVGRIIAFAIQHESVVVGLPLKTKSCPFWEFYSANLRPESAFGAIHLAVHPGFIIQFHD